MCLDAIDLALRLQKLLAQEGATDPAMYAALHSSTRWRSDGLKIYLTPDDIKGDSVVKQRASLFPCLILKNKVSIQKVWLGKAYAAPCEYFSCTDILGCWKKVTDKTAPMDLPLVAASGAAMDSDGSQSAKYRHMEGLLAAYLLGGGTGAIFQPNA